MPQTFSQVAGIPTSINDFNCYAVNITGPSVPKTGSFNACTSANNMRGKGLGTLSTAVPRGQTIELDLASGRGVSIDAYGFYSTGGHAGCNNTNRGYFLGEKTLDLSESSSVTIPISYSGEAPTITCSGDEGNNFLALIDGTFGAGSTYSTCQTVPSAGAPLPNTADTSFLTPDYTALSSEDGTYLTSECAAGNPVQIAYYQVYINAATAAQYYSSFDLRWVGYAGRAMASCAVPNDDAGAGVPTLEIFNNNSSLWEVVGNIGGTASLTITQSYNNILNYIYQGSINLRAIGGQTGAGGQCSRIQTDFVSIRFR